MALDQYSLAALIQQQMGGNAPVLGGEPMHSSASNYFWSALGDDMRRTRVVARMVATIPEPGRGVASGRVRHLEAV